MKYIEFLNESKETDNLWTLIENDDPDNVALGLAMAVNYGKEFYKRYKCTIEEYQELWNWFQEFNIRHEMPLLDTTHIVCFNKNITWIPDSIGILKNLEKILIEKGSLTELPDGICNLKNLAELNVSKNKLISLPQNFGKLTKLTLLLLNNNNLTELPNSFRNLKNLKHINLQNNLFADIPKIIAGLNKFYTIDF